MALTEYNRFVKKHRLAGKSMKQIGKMWSASGKKGKSKSKPKAKATSRATSTSRAKPKTKSTRKTAKQRGQSGVPISTAEKRVAKLWERLEQIRLAMGKPRPKVTITKKSVSIKVQGWPTVKRSNFKKAVEAFEKQAKRVFFGGKL